jgi:hypothetical protein
MIPAVSSVRSPLLAALTLLLLPACGPATVTGSPEGTDQPVVEVSPTSAQVQPAGWASFAAAVSGLPAAQPTTVTWSATSPAGAPVPSALTALPTGVRFTAPQATGTYTITATSDADPTRTGTATVLVTADPVVQVAVSPASASLETGQAADFSASVTGTRAGQPTTVTWRVADPSGASDPGALTALPAGVRFTAPLVTGIYTLTAVADADPSRSASATVVVRAGGTCADACPAPVAGVTWQCQKRFMYGTNWAWRDFAGDFGGGWGPGVTAARSSFSSAMSAMKSAGVSVIRWWMFPRLVAPSIQWGADGAPSGIGGSLVSDIQTALELAEQHDLYLMLTPFSFDNFRPTAADQGPGIKPMVIDAARRRRLLDNLVAPVARAVEASPYRHRMIAWDLINEPEWAIAGASLYGDEAFTPDSRCETVTHAQMEAFLADMVATLRANSTALVSVGGAAIKWGHSWIGLDLDFLQLHYYDWVYRWYPYQTVTLASVGLTDKPVVMGEFPMQGLTAQGGQPARTAAQLSADLWSAGYAGALSWAYNDSAFPWSPGAVSGFPSQHPCETAY